MPVEAPLATPANVSDTLAPAISTKRPLADASMTLPPTVSRPTVPTPPGATTPMRLLNVLTLMRPMPVS